VIINLLRNRELIEQNLANTRTMFHVGPVAETVPHALSLIGEGTSIVLALAGLAGLIALAIRDWRTIKTKPPASPRFVAHWLLAAPASLPWFSLSSLPTGRAAICPVRDAGRRDAGSRRSGGAGYVYPLLERRTICQIVLLLATAVPGAAYVWAFARDCLADTTRTMQAERLPTFSAMGARTLAVDRVPAPYACRR